MHDTTTATDPRSSPAPPRHRPAHAPVRRRRWRRGRRVAAIVIAVVTVAVVAAVTAVVVSTLTRPAPRELSAADGLIPDGESVSLFDDVPAVTNLDATLLAAVRAAATDARSDGVDIRLNSGWRSRDLQQRMYDDAVEGAASGTESGPSVATPDTSLHVSGDAVDVGPFDATDWLSRHGAAYGLCQVYLDEPWHYEYVATADTDGCPRMYPDATVDPRLRTGLPWST